jgi:hypothetical protein
MPDLSVTRPVRRRDDFLLARPHRRSRGDLVFALEHLRFSRKDLSVLKIDRGVRDFLIRALRRD